MTSATVHLNPREVSVSRVQKAVEKLGRPDGVLTIDVEQAQNHPEDWGDFSLFVDLHGFNAENAAGPFALPCC